MNRCTVVGVDDDSYVKLCGAIGAHSEPVGAQVFNCAVDARSGHSATSNANNHASTLRSTWDNDGWVQRGMNMTQEFNGQGCDVAHGATVDGFLQRSVIEVRKD